MMSRFFRELVPSVMLAFVLFVCVDTVFARNYVQGPSMEPNLIAGQWLVVSRLGISGTARQAFASTHEGASASTGWMPPRGAIVTLVNPNDPNTILIKRVIALAGEEIAIDRGAVFINGAPLAEPYVTYHDTRSMPLLRVPSDSIIALGDNRPSSGDSRDFGPVPRSKLIGQAILRYWPLNDFGLLPNLLPELNKNQK